MRARPNNGPCRRGVIFPVPPIAPTPTSARIPEFLAGRRTPGRTIVRRGRFLPVPPTATHLGSVSAFALGPAGPRWVFGTEIGTRWSTGRAGTRWNIDADGSEQ